MEHGQAANSMIEQKRARLILPDDAKKSLEFQNAVQMQIKQNANRAAGLVRQLLAFSRRQTLRPEVMNVGEALSELTLLLKRLLGERAVAADGGIAIYISGLGPDDIIAVAKGR